MSPVYQPPASGSGITRSLADSLYRSKYQKIVSTMDVHSATTNTAVGANNGAGGRIVWPETGTIDRLAVFISVSNGNIDLGVYDTTATTRNLLVSTGSTACASVNTWQSLTVSLAVTGGEAADLFVSASGTAAFAGSISYTAALVTLPSGYMPVTGGGVPTFAPFIIGSMFPLPATFAESGFFGTAYIPLIIARYA